MIQPHDTLLFQGDSITDCGRSREVTDANLVAALGLGYAHFAAAELLADRPGDGLAIYNRGISGNRIVDLYARMKIDIINLRPDVLSILIGVNDTGHEISGQNSVDVPKYERIYRDLLAEVRSALPKVRLVLCEPFILPNVGMAPEWAAEMDARRAVTARLAEEFGACFVPFQAMFDDALRLAPPEYWSADGVHPTSAGHWLMSRTWLRCAAKA